MKFRVGDANLVFWLLVWLGSVTIYILSSFVLVLIVGIGITSSPIDAKNIPIFLPLIGALIAFSAATLMHIFNLSFRGKRFPFCFTPWAVCCISSVGFLIF